MKANGEARLGRGLWKGGRKGEEKREAGRERRAAIERRSNYKRTGKGRP